MNGFSKGEKRRVRIGVQLLTDSRILIMDEPTSGLDAFTAASIVRVLQSFAAQNRTVVFTIRLVHSNFFHHFDHVLLLGRGGHPVYAGEGQAMLPFFSDMGYDFALDLVIVDLQLAAEATESIQSAYSLVTR